MLWILLNAVRKDKVLRKGYWEVEITYCTSVVLLSSNILKCQKQ